MYCGIDIIEVSRIESAIISNDEFKFNIYSKKEIEEIDSIKTNVKYQRYAGRFAAKEAIYKAISKILIDNKKSIKFKEIEIINSKEYKRRPEVKFLNKDVSKILKEYDIDVSISHIDASACAMCTAKKI